MHTVAFAQSTHPIAAAASPKAIWIGRVVSTLPVLFLTFDAVIKLAMLPVAVDATKQLGFPEHTVFAIGAIEALCLTLYVIPRTSVLGAVLWIGYFGGAIVTHLRADSPLLTHTLSPLVFAALLWLGLWLRDARLRTIVRTAFDAPA